MENFKLKDFYLNEDYTKDVNIDDPSKLYDPVNENNDILKYNTKDSLLNPELYAIGDTNINWKSYIEQVPR